MSTPSQDEELPLPKPDSFFETKTFRLLTLGLYMAGVSGMGMTLAMYYLFIWDSRMPPLPEFKHTHHVAEHQKDAVYYKNLNISEDIYCEDQIVIPEKIAIRLLNSSEVTAEQFYRHILEQYRILNHLQQQRQQYLQKQQLQMQQLTAANKFQEIFATATIIQTNRNDHYKKLMTTTNGTALLEPKTPITTIEEQQQQQQLQQLQLQPHMAPILDTTTTHLKRKTHRKHYNHHRHNTRKNHRKLQTNPEVTEPQQQRYIDNAEIIEPATLVMEPQTYTSMPIPLILNTREEKRPHHHEHAGKMSALLQPRRRTTSATSAGVVYERPTYMNPFLTGELIFEK